MSHRNAPLTPEGRRRLCERIDAGRPIAHVATEAHISRRCLAKWYAQRQAHGDDGLADRSSRPVTSPRATAAEIADLIELVRIADNLARQHAITIAAATVHVC